MLAGINYLAVAAAALVVMPLGFLYFAPGLFGKAWMKELGFKAEDLDPKDAMKGHVVMIIGAFITAWAMAVLIKYMGVGGWLGGLKLGLGVGVAFMATTMISNDIYERRSFKLSLINSFFRLLQTGLAGVILAVWP